MTPIAHIDTAMGSISGVAALAMRRRTAPAEARNVLLGKLWMRGNGAQGDRDRDAIRDLSDSRSGRDDHPSPAQRQPYAAACLILPDEKRPRQVRGAAAIF